MNEPNTEENPLNDLNRWFNQSFSAELPLGSHRHADDGVHGGDDERGEGDVLHRQIHVCRAITQ